jgi:hypothetical protein
LLLGTSWDEGTSLARNNIPIVPHPPYSPDLAPSDFWLFPTLKMSLRGRRFATVKDFKENADARLRAIKKEDFHQCYNNWIDRWNKSVCVCVQMENTSKAINFVNHGFHIIKTANFFNAPRIFPVGHSRLISNHSSVTV